MTDSGTRVRSARAVASDPMAAVATARGRDRHLLDYTGGTLVMPMTVLVEQYWRVKGGLDI